MLALRWEKPSWLSLGPTLADRVLYDPPSHKTLPDSLSTSAHSPSKEDSKFGGRRINDDVGGLKRDGDGNDGFDGE
jgi:hypothetical protein